MLTATSLTVGAEEDALVGLRLSRDYAPAETRDDLVVHVDAFEQFVSEHSDETAAAEVMSDPAVVCVLV